MFYFCFTDEATEIKVLSNLFRFKTASKWQGLFLNKIQVIKTDQDNNYYR